MSAFDCFVRLARVGDHAKATPREVAARRLALLVLDAGMQLDQASWIGFTEFVQMVRTVPAALAGLVDAPPPHPAVREFKGRGPVRS